MEISVRGKISLKLAEKFGFCWAVDWAIRIAYEARKQFQVERFGSPMGLFTTQLLISSLNFMLDLHNDLNLEGTC